MIHQVREVHVSRAARLRYDVDDSLFTLSGSLVLSDLRAVRQLAARMTAARREAGATEPAVSPAALNAMGLIEEVLHAVVAIYREHEDAEALDDALDHLDARLGAEAIDTLLLRFTAEFPPGAVHRMEITPEAYLAGETAGVPNREIALEELVACWLENANPALTPYRELFADDDLAATTAYRAVIEELGRFFASRPPIGPDRQPLLAMLRAPAIAEPHSLVGQLRWIRARWGHFLAGHLDERLGALVDRIVTGLDVAAEEDRAHWLRLHPPAGGGDGAPTLGDADEPERYSEDLAWMPRVVLLAKSTYVWLDQLSRAHGREIRTLDAIPDDELDRLARWGVTGLWLIGLWERSRASATIKRLRGNPDAVASAYSVFDYAIAEDLGGEAAWANLRDRAMARGIRLASDMVPNHMGIDSRWVVEHPDRFLARPDSPFPAYTFTGPDLSDDPRVAIQIEDHYWDSTDAAVVFRREDRATGDVRFIYHGNDGTSMPWNDTAQLDYLDPATREAVIQAILAVARRFPIIRFDAAMTLAKRHVARLWYPEPGEGGAIPSRAEHALPRVAFDAAMPEEFWREVVDRVAAEVPDTLLLAEAFWLMEGYFVRTLGMHRVYNSAFMHMLRDERNAEYRLLVKNTLEFDPEILKRYVNFMSNPDERTAVEQFGTGDKYFGIATVMATMPGLPMIGHGQVEGFAEKYGMEFRRAYWDERPNEGLLDRHERQVFPLFRRRSLFAEVREFRLYDVVDDAGHVSEDVLAYSNRQGGERSLIVYHNRFATARGRIRDSVAFAARDADGTRRVVRTTLADGLGLAADGGAVAIYRDAVAGLEYVREVADLRSRGLRVDLSAYATLVLLDWREVAGDAAAEHRALARELAGAGVPSVEAALAERRLRPLHDAVAILVNGALVRDITDALAAHLAAAAAREASIARGARPAPPDLTSVVAEWQGRARDALVAVSAATGRSLPDPDLEALAVRFGARVRAALDAALAAPGRDELGAPEPTAGTSAAPAAVDQTTDGDRDAARTFVAAALPPDTATWGALLGLLAADALAGVLEPDPAARQARGWFDAAQLGRVFADAFRWRGLDERDAWRTVDAVRHLLARPGATALEAPPADRAARLVRAWLSDDDLARWLGVNHHDGIAYLHRESFEAALRWLVVLVAIDVPAAPSADAEGRPALEAVHVLAIRLADDAAVSGWDIGKLLARVTS